MTTSPGQDTVLYDGECRFCSKAARQLRSLTAGEVMLLSFRDPGVLQRFPGITEEACNKAMHFVRSDGRVFKGAEAAVQALRGRWFGKAAYVYYVPGIRQVSDAVYAVIARYRFRIAGRECVDGTCHLHMD
ncbi:MAG: DUF393 domain-containing protein [Myxococcaceae bacterium]